MKYPYKKVQKLSLEKQVRFWLLLEGGHDANKAYEEAKDLKPTIPNKENDWAIDSLIYDKVVFEEIKNVSYGNGFLMYYLAFCGDQERKDFFSNKKTFLEKAEWYIDNCRKDLDKDVKNGMLKMLKWKTELAEEGNGTR